MTLNEREALAGVARGLIELLDCLASEHATLIDYRQIKCQDAAKKLLEVLDAEARKELLP